MIDLYNLLTSENIVEEINNNLDSLLKLIPEIEKMIGFEHRHPEHFTDVWNHTLYALSLSENDFEIRLVLLLHDIGKPYHFTEGEIRHFNNHPKYSKEISESILKRLNYDEKFIRKICFLIENHDYRISNSLIQNDKELALKLYKIQECDALAHHPEKLEKRKIYLKQIKEKIENSD